MDNARGGAGIKYRRDLSSLAEGPFMGFLAQNARDILVALAGEGSPDTNTARYNATRAAYNLAAVPGLARLLTALPGGPFASAAYGAALMYGTGRGAADVAATALNGPKGMKNDGTLPPDPSTMSRVEKLQYQRLQAQKDNPAIAVQDHGRQGGLMGGVPIGLADDFIAPGIRLAGPAWNALPTAGKVAVGGVAAAFVGKTLAEIFSHPTPHRARPGQ